VEIVWKAGEILSLLFAAFGVGKGRAAYRLQDEARLGRRSLHDRAVRHHAVAQDRTGHMRTVAVRIAGVIRSPQGVQLSHPPGERGMGVVGLPHVEPGVGNRDDLTVALVRAAGLRVGGAQDSTRDVVEQSGFEVGLDVMNFVDGGEGREASAFDRQADLVRAYPQLVGRLARGGGDFVTDRLAPRIAM